MSLALLNIVKPLNHALNSDILSNINEVKISNLGEQAKVDAESVPKGAFVGTTIIFTIKNIIFIFGMVMQFK